ncbi:MAG: Hint domain-containing protein [Burkholderiaceae bacterium]
MYIFRQRILFGAATFALAMLCQPVFADQATLPTSTQNLNAYLLSNTKPNKTYTLNLGNPLHQQQVLETLVAAGKTPQNSPQLFKTLNATIANSSRQLGGTSSGATPVMVSASAAAAPQDLNTIIDFEQSSTTTGTFISTAMSTVVGGTNISTIKVDITSPDGKTVYGTNTQSQLAQGTEFLVTATATNVPSNVTPLTQATFTYVATTSTSAAADLITAYATATLMQPAGGNSTMTAPNHCLTWSDTTCTSYSTTPTNTGVATLTPITYCFQRRVAGTCDYFKPGTSPASSFLITTAGTANFVNTVRSPVSGTWTAQVVSPTGGACVLQYEAPMDGNPQWTINTKNPAQLVWNIPQVTTTSPTACLKYVSGQVLSFLFTGNVKLSGTGTASQGTFQFTSNTSQTGQGIFIVPTLNLLDSCIAKGTLITMDKGRSKLIENISTDNHDVVLNEHHVAKKVEATSRGSEMFPMIQITTDKKQTVLLTRTHPVSTPNGFVMAQDLKVKDLLKTIKGTAKIVSLKPVKYAGTVHNISLGTIEDAKTGASTFYANGILVGDLRTQTHYENLERATLKKDPAHVCDRLPVEWKVDGGCVAGIAK